MAGAPVAPETLSYAGQGWKRGLLTFVLGYFIHDKAHDPIDSDHTGCRRQDEMLKRL